MFNAIRTIYNKNPINLWAEARIVYYKPVSETPKDFISPYEIF